MSRAGMARGMNAAVPRVSWIGAYSSGSRRSRACRRWLRTRVESRHRRFVASLQGSLSSLIARLPSQGFSREAPVARDAPRLGSGPASTCSPRLSACIRHRLRVRRALRRKKFAGGAASGGGGGLVRGFASGLGGWFHRGRAVHGIGPVCVGVRVFPNPVPDQSLESRPGHFSARLDAASSYRNQNPRRDGPAGGFSV